MVSFFFFLQVLVSMLFRQILCKGIPLGLFYLVLTSRPAVQIGSMPRGSPLLLNLYLSLHIHSIMRSSTLSASTSMLASYESGFSSGSWPRSTTLGLQSFITISLSPNNLSEHKNFFTQPPPQDSDVTPNSTLLPTSPY